jgi:Raf kinase inhibitor-like YbhB/YbcL family protein
LCIWRPRTIFFYNPDGLLPTPGGLQMRKGGYMSIHLASTAFVEGTIIPKRHAGDGANLSPALAWPKAAQGVKSYALIVEDPDAPSGTFVHWVVFNIPVETDKLPEGVAVGKEIAGGGRQGMNDARINGYYGPNPPPGKPHRYFIKLFALDALLDLPAGASAAQLQKAMQGHQLDTGSLMGTYHR